MDFIIEKVDELPPRQPPKKPAPVADGWPTETDLAMLREMWKRQAYAGYTKCHSCPTMEYCYGPTYERKGCFACFTEKHRPKRKYTRRQK